MFTLKQTFTKTDDQDWSNLYINVEKSVSSTPDPRDSMNSENRTTMKSFSPKTVSANGYSGWDREYIDDNNLVIKYYFDTESDAKLYHGKRIQKVADFLSNSANNSQTSHTVSWVLVEGNTTFSLG
jgi:hypothetical protein